MTTENDDRNVRDRINLILVLVGAVAAAYVVFLWLN
jgi:hypothetical protein